MANQSFGRHERIRKKTDYARIYQRGIRGYSTHFTWIVRDSPAGFSRLGITAGEKVGKAVKRNRIKRLLREFFRLNKSRLPEGQDIVIMVRPRTPFMTYALVLKELEGLFRDKSGE